MGRRTAPPPDSRPALDSWWVVGYTHCMIAASDERRRLTLPPDEPPRAPYEVLREGDRRIVLLRRDPVRKGALLQLCRTLAALPENPLPGKLFDWQP